MRALLIAAQLAAAALAAKRPDPPPPPPPQDQRPPRQYFQNTGIPILHYRETLTDLEQRRPRVEEPRFVTPKAPAGAAAPAPGRPPRYHDWGGASAGAGSGRADLVEFGRTFADVVSGHVLAESRKTGGAFVVKDEATGESLRLKLLHVHQERLRQLAPGEVSGCADFETDSSPKRTVDLDFLLSNEDWEWRVARVGVHAVNGRARYGYDEAGRVARAVAPAAPAVPKPTAPAKLAVSVAFREPSGDDVLDGGETGSLEVTVANSGKGAAYAVRVLADLQAALPGLSIPAETELGTIAPGASAKAALPLAAAGDAASGAARVALSVNEGNGFDAEPVVVELQTRAYRPPRLEVAAVELLGGVLRAGEPTQVSVLVRNAGEGAARGATATLALGASDVFMSGEPTAALGDLPPGASARAEFEFFVNKRYKAGQKVPVSVRLRDARSASSFPLGLALGETAPAPRVVSVKAKEAPAPRPEAEDVDAPPASAMEPDPEAYAVVVGIERYRDVPPVEYAARDAQTVRDYLVGAMGYDPKNVVLLQNERAALTDLATYLGPWLADRATKRSRVFVYYAGHGAPDPATGEGYLMPYDGDPSYTDTKAFPIRRLMASLSRLPAKEVTVALDACFSGSGGRSVLAKGARPLVTATRAALELGDNVVLLTAASGSQISTFQPEARHGLLTYHLLKGLRGGADADKNGAVTTAELFDYVRPAVERAARLRHVEQTPTLLPEKLGARGKRVWLKTR